MRRLALLTLAVLASAGCSDRSGRERAAQAQRSSPSSELVRVDTGITHSADSSPEPATTPAEESRPAPEPATPAYREPERDTTVTDTVSAAETPAAPSPGPSDTAPPAASGAVGDTTSEVEPSPATAAGSPSATTTRTLPAGTEIHAALDDSISSRRDSAGRTITAEVMQAVSDPGGAVVVPAGARVRLTVTQLAPAGSRSAADGQLALRVDSIAIGDNVVPVKARIQQVPHELKGRGVTGSEAAKVGAGAAAGAVAGRVLGGDAKGAVIGGVVGAAGGAAVATQTAKRDVVVAARTPVSFVLDAPLVAAVAEPSSP